MGKFIFLYQGPAPADIGMDHAPLTQAGLDQWARSIGSALVDRGTLFGSNGSGVTDRGVMHTGVLPIHGYSIVEAANLQGAIALTQGHPFLQNGRDANFEIQILDLTDGERPLNIAELETQYLPGTAVTEPLGSLPGETVANLQQQAPQPQQFPQQPQSTQVFQPQAPQPPQPPQSPTELRVSHDEPQQPADQNGPNLPPPQNWQ